MVTMQHSGFSPIPSVFNALLDHAEWQVNLTLEVLTRRGCNKSQLLQFPEPLLLEFGAMVVLEYWEYEGLLKHMNATYLPSLAQAQQDLTASLKRGIDHFDTSKNASLSAKVIWAWLDNFAWDGQKLLDIDVVVKQTEDDPFIDLLAEFVLKNSDELHQILESTGDEE